MKLSVRNASGKELEQLDVADEVFGLTPNPAVIHQVYVAQMNARRHGLANTKTRGEVRGSTAKVRRQKGLGRARVGSERSPIRVGGGVAFGPKTRSYEQTIPKRLRRLAIRSALSAKAGDGELFVVDGFGDEIGTAGLRKVLSGVGVLRSSLVVTAAPDTNTRLSARNLKGTTVLPANYLNVADLLNHRSLVMTREAVRATEALWGGERATSRRAPLAESSPPQATPVKRKPDEGEAPTTKARPAAKKSDKAAKPRAVAASRTQPARRASAGSRSAAPGKGQDSS
jgi:large subunit ribosomal protein L4